MVNPNVMYTGYINKKYVLKKIFASIFNAFHLSVSTAIFVNIICRPSYSQRHHQAEDTQTFSRSFTEKF